MNEPDAKAVEALAKELREAMSAGQVWDFQRGARYVISREAGLLAALEDVETNGRAYELSYTVPRNTLRRVQDALAAHRAAYGPKPEPTLAEAVEAMIASAPQIVFGSAPVDHAPLDADGVRLSLVRPAALDAVKAALARERGKP